MKCYFKKKEENEQQISTLENQIEQLGKEKEQHENNIATLQKKKLILQLIWIIKRHIEY